MSGRHNGNPNWAIPGKVGAPHIKACSFDEAVRILHLSPEQYGNSKALHRWADQYKDKKYIPQDLLSLWKIYPQPYCVPESPFRWRHKK